MEVKIRRLKLEDAADLRRLIAKRETIFRLSDTKPPYSLTDIKKYVSAQLKKEHYKELSILASGKLVGTLSLEKINPQDKSASIGYWVAKSYRNKGIATSAVKLASYFAFAKLGLREIRAETEKSNIASRRVLEKSGFAIERTSRTKVHYTLAITVV
jgi:RimJ/RimL family protein N-acetyltransferase